MSMCVKAITQAYEDDKRETFNSLLRVKTPFPKRNESEELAVKTASCACFPIKCLEGVGMITFGAFLWPIPCTVCKIETEDSGTDVSLKKVYPGFRKPNIPCHYEDTYCVENQITQTSGYSTSCFLGQRPEGEQKRIIAVSSATGYDCLSSGVGKIFNTLLSMICCPISCVSLVCCKKEDA